MKKVFGLLFGCFMLLGIASAVAGDVSIPEKHVTIKLLQGEEPFTGTLVQVKITGMGSEIYANPTGEPGVFKTLVPSKNFEYQIDVWNEGFVKPIHIGSGKTLANGENSEIISIQVSFDPLIESPLPSK